MSRTVDTNHQRPTMPDISTTTSGQVKRPTPTTRIQKEPSLVSVANGKTVRRSSFEIRNFALRHFFAGECVCINAIRLPFPASTASWNRRSTVADLDRSVHFTNPCSGFRSSTAATALRSGRGGPAESYCSSRRASARMSVTAHDGSGELHLAFAIPASDLAAWEARLAAHDVPVEERREWPAAALACTSATRTATRSSSPRRGLEPSTDGARSCAYRVIEAKGRGGTPNRT